MYSKIFLFFIFLENCNAHPRVSGSSPHSDEEKNPMSVISEKSDSSGEPTPKKPRLQKKEKNLKRQKSEEKSAQILSSVKKRNKSLSKRNGMVKRSIDLKALQEKRSLKEKTLENLIKKLALEQTRPKSRELKTQKKN